MDEPEEVRRRFAGMLWRLADLVQADERGRSFRSKAYRRAVWSLDALAADLDQPPEQLLEVPGIGPGVATLIREFKTTGRLKQLELLESRYPRDVARMRRLPRANPGLLRALKEELGVETLDDLEHSIATGALTTLRGVGDTTAELWSRTLNLAPGPGMVPSHRAWALARQMGGHLEGHLDAAVALAGEVRRVEEWVAWVDLVTASDDLPRVRRFLDLTAVASRSEPVDEGIHRLRTHDDIGVTVHLTLSEGLGTTLLRLPGRRGMSRRSSPRRRHPFPPSRRCIGPAGWAGCRRRRGGSLSTGRARWSGWPTCAAISTSTPTGRPTAGCPSLRWPAPSALGVIDTC